MGAHARIQNEAHGRAEAHPYQSMRTRGSAPLPDRRGATAWNQPIRLRRDYDLRTEMENIDEKPPRGLPYVKQINRGEVDTTICD